MQDPTPDTPRQLPRQVPGNSDDSPTKPVGRPSDLTSFGSAPSESARVAVVIPTLNEAESLAETLERVIGLADEVVVSDGGSADGTVAEAVRAGARVVEGSPGRGIQLNRGAQATDSEILVFLHADTRLGDHAIERARSACLHGAVGGGYFVSFDVAPPVLRLGTRLINLRTRTTRCPLGDQAQFVTREAFEALGGFQDWPILEDLDFVRRLKRLGRIELLHPPVETSSRRFLGGGVAKTVAINWMIWGLYFLGVPPDRLGSLYKVIR